MTDSTCSTPSSSPTAARSPAASSARSGASASARSPSTATRMPMRRTCARRMPPTASVPPPRRCPTSTRGAILAAARESGAQAIHPGYGFLSENVGVRPRLRGGRHRLHRTGGARARRHGRQDPLEGARLARAACRSSRASMRPGSRDDEIADAAAGVGYPLLIKPSAGGGGKGMQVVREAAALPEALATARRVASAAFGDDTLLLERLIERPRHIEVQVIAAADGTVLHLGERECTLQRRHQKVIEEAPSPIVDAADARAPRRGGVRGRGQRRLPRRGHGRVPRRRRASRRVLLHRDEHPPAGRAPRHRARHRARPRRAAAAGRRRASRSGSPRTTCASPGTPSRRASTPRAPSAGSVPATGDVLGWLAPTGPNVRVDSAIETGSRGQPGLRPDDREGHRVGRRPRGGARDARRRAGRDRRCSGSTRTSPSCARCSRMPRCGPATSTPGSSTGCRPSRRPSRRPRALAAAAAAVERGTVAAAPTAPVRHPRSGVRHPAVGSPASPRRAATSSRPTTARSSSAAAPPDGQAVSMGTRANRRALGHAGPAGPASRRTATARSGCTPTAPPTGSRPLTRREALERRLAEADGDIAAAHPELRRPHAGHRRRRARRRRRRRRRRASASSPSRR